MLDLLMKTVLPSRRLELKTDMVGACEDWRRRCGGARQARVGEASKGMRVRSGLEVEERRREKPFTLMHKSKGKTAR